MRKTKFCAPYEGDKVKPTMLYKRLNSTKTGVYIIRRKEDKVILYVGYSQSDLIKTAYRHFQKWTDPTQYRFTTNAAKCEIQFILTSSSKISATLERILIKTMKPKKNERTPEGDPTAQELAILEQLEAADSIEPDLSEAAKYKKAQSAGILVTGQTKNLKTLTTKKKKK